jgi:hypothetical protein
MTKQEYSLPIKKILACQDQLIHGIKILGETEIKLIHLKNKFLGQRRKS